MFYSYASGGRSSATVARIPKPTNFVAEVDGDTVTLTWDDVVAAVTYEVYHNGSWVDVGDVLTKEYTGLANGDYTYRVRGVDVEAIKGQAAVVNFTISVEEAEGFSYLRPDGVSGYLRPDGVSTYLRP